MVYNRRPAMRAAMAEIYANRRDRLLQLIYDRFEWNQSKCARALGFSRTNISEYANGGKPIGELVAARIEREAKLPPGWLDAHDPDRPPITRVFMRGPNDQLRDLKRKTKRSPQPHSAAA